MKRRRDMWDCGWQSFDLFFISFLGLIVVSFANSIHALSTENTFEKNLESNNNNQSNNNNKECSKTGQVCLIGCTPYADPSDENGGIRKFDALIRDMAENCEVMVHLGDTKAGAAPCNANLMADPLHKMIAAANDTGAILLYAPGDNELNDCHMEASRTDNNAAARADFYSAQKARDFLVREFRLWPDHQFDLTGTHGVVKHRKNGIIPGTADLKYSCNFDTFVAPKDRNYAVATLECLGSQWYLKDERKKYPKQNIVDPLANRLAMYLNAKDCALEWIEWSAERASNGGKRVLVFALHAHFWKTSSVTKLDGYLRADRDNIGPYYSPAKLRRITKSLTGIAIEHAYQPLYDKLIEVAFAYPDIHFYVVNADKHVWAELQMPSDASNVGNRIESHQNLNVVQVEGDSRALTTYAKFMIDADAFQPVTVKEEWSEAAFNEPPVGHAFYKYK